MRRLTVTEGQSFSIDMALAPRLRAAMTRLEQQLRPTLSFFKEDGDRFVIHNMIGTIRLSGQAVIEVEPKTQENDDWVAAVLDLIIGGDRIDIGGDRLGGRIPQPTQLLDVLAAVYADRLLLAMRRDGPIRVVSRRSTVLGFIKGKLDTTEYVRTACLAPHRFPVSFDDITVDNDFSRTLALVAHCLATATGSLTIRSTLSDLAETLSEGRSIDLTMDPTIARREIPSQWAVYKPAWSIAVAVLSHMSLLRPIGNEHGLEVAIESWPLLERLLTRALDQVPSLTGEELNLRPKSRQETVLLEPIGLNGLKRGVHPDGELVRGDRTVATFEAKYSPKGGEWPKRDHVFQAIAAARACNSPLAVLVYPEMFEPQWAEVHAKGDYPYHLVAIGLGLFSYRKGARDRECAIRIKNLLRDSQALINHRSAIPERSSHHATC